MQMVKITHISFIAHFDRQLGNQRKFHFNCSYEFWIIRKHLIVKEAATAYFSIS